MNSLKQNHCSGPAFSYPRHRAREIRVGWVAVGGTAPVILQSMTNTDTRAPAATISQIQRLAKAGCQLIRVAVPDQTAVRALPAIMAEIPLPLIADVHFNSELALAAVEAGVQGLRINPGTIRDQQKLKAIGQAAAAAGVAVRVGVNGGSLEPEVLARHNDRATAAALVESALTHCARFEGWGCHNLKASLKSSSVPTTVEACRRFAAVTDYPLHLGLTEAGLPEAGAVKSAAALGCLLMEGIGDTIRISLTGDPVQEIIVGRRILAACGLGSSGPEVVACPTCGRTEIDLHRLATEVEEELRRLETEGAVVELRKIAVMGCSVNGPGEAKDADLGIAGGRRRGVLFKHGKIICALPEEELKSRLLDEIRECTRFPDSKSLVSGYKSNSINWL